MTQEQIAEREIRLLEEIKQDLQCRIDRIRRNIEQPVLCSHIHTENQATIICRYPALENGYCKRHQGTESIEPASKDGFIERCPPLFGKNVFSEMPQQDFDPFTELMEKK